MLIFIYGKDTYRSRQKMKEIIGQYCSVHSSGLNLKILEKNETFSDLIDYNKQVSMFDEKRLFVLNHIFSNANFKESIITNINSILDSDNIFIIYQEEDIRKNDKLLNILKKIKDKKRTIIQEFSFLADKKLSLWIEEEFRKNDIVVDEDAVTKLQEMCGSDTWRLKSEIEKLSSYKNKIAEKDVSLLVSGSVSVDIFKTVDAMGEKDAKKALVFFYNHLKKQENPQYLLAMIVYQFRNLFIIKDLTEKGFSYNEARIKSGINPYVFSKAYYQSQNFSKEDLKNIYNALFEIDLKTKTGQIDPVLALHFFLFNALV